MNRPTRIYTIKECDNCRGNQLNHDKQDTKYGEFIRRMMKVDENKYTCSICGEVNGRVAPYMKRRSNDK